MPDSLSLEVLFRVLPMTPALSELRAGLLAVASPDPERRWSGSAEYGTVDQRVVTTESLQSLFSSAEMRAVGEARTLHRTVREAVLALARGRPVDALASMILHGEAAAREARWGDCLPYYSVAEVLAVEAEDYGNAALSARRIARAFLYLGDAPRAAAAYTRSLAAGENANSIVDRVIALTGLGHVAAVRGGWSEAEAHYRDGYALAAAGGTSGTGDARAELAQLRVQLCINLATASREQRRFDESARWLETADADRSAMAPADESVWHNAQGMLLLERGELEQANHAFQRALALSPNHHDNAMILDNLAAVAQRAGQLREAELYARRAEDFAIAGAAPRALAEAYIRLGRIMHARGDDNGIGFFEKAIELAREHGYRQTEATAYRAYAAFRTVLGDADDAAALIDAAAAIEASLADSAGKPPAP